MRLCKYVNPWLVAGIGVTLSILYCGFSRATVENSFSVIQHPFLTIFLYCGFLLLILPFNFSNPLFSLRFPDGITKQLTCFDWLTELSALYAAAAIVLFNVLGVILGQPFILHHQMIYAAYTVFSLCVLDALIVVLSEWKGKTAAFTVCISLTAAGFGLNYFGGSLFGGVNFLFYNMQDTLDFKKLTVSIITYGVIALLCTLLSFKNSKRRKEV